MKIVIKRKQMFFELISLLIILLVFAFGWLYLNYIFNIAQKPFDFNIYFDHNEGTVAQEKSITSTIIVFSNFSKPKAVEILVSNCPKYSTCTLSIANSDPTFTSDLTITASELTPPGDYPINILVVGGGINKATTYYLTIKSKECICTSWVSQGCGGRCDSEMYVVRKCEPKSCDIESRCAYNSSCIKDFSIKSIPTYSRVFEQKVSFIINITSLNDFSGLVYLSASNCPNGSVCSYSLSPVNVPLKGSATSSLIIKTALAAVTGDFTITTKGVSNNTIHSTNSTITIA